ncbi:hypothetical protein E4U32_001886 [Claviceps aff. humidiphila group G2b]|nr:hypothetical protein E4U32_001886 [Claviceps aff. humidiphila group G2b]
MLMAVLQQALREMAVETQSANRETFNIIGAVNGALDRDDAVTARRLRSGDTNENPTAWTFRVAADARPARSRLRGARESATLAELESYLSVEAERPKGRGDTLVRSLTSHQ